jgi:hypothetical protein
MQVHATSPHTQMRAHVLSHTHVQHTRTRTRTHTRTRTRTHTHTHTHTHIHTHTRTHAHIHTRTRTRTHTHMYTHTHTRVLRSSQFFVAYIIRGQQVHLFTFQRQETSSCKCSVLPDKAHIKNRKYACLPPTPVLAVSMR